MSRQDYINLYSTFAVKHSFTYDYDRSLDENLQDTAGQLNEMEEYQLEEMHYHRGR